MRALKTWFMDLQIREKLLLAGFVLMGALIWLTAFSRRAAAYWSAEARNLATLRTQQQVLDSRDQVEQRARDAAARLSAGLTLDSGQLFTRVNQLAATAGWANSARINTQAEGEAGTAAQLALHFVNLQVSGVSWDSLRSFYISVLKQSPYLNIEQMNVSVVTNQRGGSSTPSYNVTMRISSVEVKS